MKPLKYAEKMYQFAGLSMTTEMKSWIITNTQVKLLRIVCTNVDQNLIANQCNFRAKYLQNGEENWTK